MGSDDPARREPGRRTLLSEFLRARRTALKPEDVGLPARAGRRVTGLRREEVAVLADVGITWYTWLEQGRPIRIAPATLERIADALRLDRHERAYLKLLILGEEPRPAWDVPLPDNIARLVRSYQIGPAFALGPRWDILAFNDEYLRVFQMPDAPGLNGLRIAFTNPAMPSLYVDWPRQTRRVVAAFRVSYARHIGDEAFESLVAELMTKSPLFAELWAESNVLSPTEDRTGVLTDTPTLFTGVSLIVPDCPETVVWFLLAEDQDSQAEPGRSP